MKKIIALFGFALLHHCAVSQIAPSDTTKSKSLQLNEEVSPSKGSGAEYNNIVRWNMLELGRGLVSFGYERRINDYLSFDVQLGYTLRDYSADVLSELEDNGGTAEITAESYKINGDFAYMLGIRIYPTGHGEMRGFYVEPHYFSKKWNYEKTIINQNYDVYSTTETSEKLSYKFYPTEQDYGIKCGWQTKRPGSRIYLNPYFGLLYRVRNAYNIETGMPIYRKDDFNNRTESYVKTVEKKVSAGFVLGFNIGVGF